MGEQEAAYLCNLSREQRDRRSAALEGTRQTSGQAHGQVGMLDLEINRSICEQAQLPLLARSCGWRMSAFPPLLRGKQTLGGWAEIDAHDPEATFMQDDCGSGRTVRQGRTRTQRT